MQKQNDITIIEGNLEIIKSENGIERFAIRDHEGMLSMIKNDDLLTVFNTKARKGTIIPQYKVSLFTYNARVGRKPGDALAHTQGHYQSPDYHMTVKGHDDRKFRTMPLHHIFLSVNDTVAKRREMKQEYLSEINTWVDAFDKQKPARIIRGITVLK